MSYQVSKNSPPLLLKASDFDQWSISFTDFISKRENGDYMVKSFSEGPMIRTGEDYTEEELHQKNANREASSNLLYAINRLSPHIYNHVNCFRNNPMQMWNEFTKLIHGSYVAFRVNVKEDYKEKNASETKEENKVDAKKNEEKKEREENEEMKVVIEDSKKIAELTKKVSDLENSLAKEREGHEKERMGLLLRVSDLEKELEKKENKESEEKKDDEEDSEIVIELKRRLTEVKELLTLERQDHKKEKEALVQRNFYLEVELKMKDKECEDKKGLDHTCKRLSKQNSDFQKVLFLEKEKVEKERVEFDNQRKIFEMKNRKLMEKISTLQQEMDRDCAELEKMKKANFQAKCVKDDFSVERKIFQQEIKKLTKNLAGLSTDIMKEKRTNCDIQKKLDLMTKERNALSDKVKSFNKSECYSDYPMRPSNIFYDHSVDRTSKSYADLPSYKRVNMQWKVKAKTPERDVPKSSFPNKSTKPNAKSFVKPDSTFSANNLIRFAQKNMCCSYCGNNDFVKNANVQFWYGTYHVSSYRTPLNVSGPKTRWVPKST